MTVRVIDEVSYEAGMYLQNTINI